MNAEARARLRKLTTQDPLIDLLDALDAAEAEGARLTAERDAASKLSGIHHALAENIALRAKVERLTAVLREAKVCIARLAPPSVAPDDDADGWAAIHVLASLDAALDAARAGPS